MGFLSLDSVVLSCGAPVEPLVVVFAQVPQLMTKLGNEGWNPNFLRQGFFLAHVYYKKAWKGQVLE